MHVVLNENEGRSFNILSLGTNEVTTKIPSNIYTFMQRLYDTIIRQNYNQAHFIIKFKLNIIIPWFLRASKKPTPARLGLTRPNPTRFFSVFFGSGLLPVQETWKELGILTCQFGSVTLTTQTEPKLNEYRSDLGKERNKQTGTDAKMASSSSSSGAGASHCDMPWVEKYQPNEVVDVVSNEDAVSRLRVSGALEENPARACIDCFCSDFFFATLGPISPNICYVG